MASCCDSILDLGCVDECNLMTFASSADQTGVHTITFDAGVGGRAQVTETVTAGNPITHTNLGDLQPGYTYTVNIVNPDGTEFTDIVSSVTYDCWKIKLVDIITVT